MEPVIAAVLALGALAARAFTPLVERAVAHVVRRFLRLPPPEPQEPTLEDRVNESAQALREASQIVDQLGGELQARQAAVEQLQRQHQLLELKQDQIDAITATLGAQASQERRRSTWIGVGSNAIFFVLGVVITLLVS